MSVSAPTFKSSQRSHGFYILCPTRSKVSLRNGSPGLPTWVPQGSPMEHTKLCSLPLCLLRIWKHVTDIITHVTLQPPLLRDAIFFLMLAPASHWASMRLLLGLATTSAALQIPISSLLISALQQHPVWPSCSPYSRIHSAGGRSTSGKALLLGGWRPF